MSGLFLCFYFSLVSLNSWPPCSMVIAFGENTNSKPAGSKLNLVSLKGFSGKDSCPVAWQISTPFSSLICNL